MDKAIYNFWSKNSLTNIKPARGGEFPEGWDVIDFFKNLYSEEEYGSILDIGCGYGRLCNAFNAKNYCGLDISSHAIEKAQKVHPEYKFSLLDYSINLPPSDTKLVYTVLLHQTDEDIDTIVKTLCNTTRRIIVAEICGRDWRRSGNPPVFNRNKQEYIELFNAYGKNIEKQYSKPYKAYKGTNIDILVFI